MRYYTAFPFGYCGTFLLRGEVVNLREAPNDALLIRMGYFKRVTPSDERGVVGCDACGKKFLDVSILHSHRREGLCGKTNKELSELASRNDRDVLASLPDAKKEELGVRF